MIVERDSYNDTRDRLLLNLNLEKLVSLTSLNVKLTPNIL